MGAPRILASVGTSPVAVTAGGAGYAVSITQPGPTFTAFKVYDQNQNQIGGPIVGNNGSYIWTAPGGQAFVAGQVVGYVAVFSGTATFLVSDTSPVPYPQPISGQAFPNAGAITLKTGRALLTGATATAYTLALPTPGADDFKELTVVNHTGQAHTVTTPALGINGTSDTITFATTVGSTAVLVPYQGQWDLRMATGNGLTLSEV
jgi:hypothetical protein